MAWTATWTSSGARAGRLRSSCYPLSRHSLALSLCNRTYKAKILCPMQNRSPDRGGRHIQVGLNWWREEDEASQANAQSNMDGDMVASVASLGSGGSDVVLAMFTPNARAMQDTAKRAKGTVLTLRVWSRSLSGWSEAGLDIARRRVGERLAML